MNHQAFLATWNGTQNSSNWLFPLFHTPRRGKRYFKSSFPQQFGESTVQKKKNHNVFWPLLPRRIFLGMTFLTISTYKHRNLHSHRPPHQTIQEISVSPLTCVWYWGASSPEFQFHPTPWVLHSQCFDSIARDCYWLHPKNRCP